MVANISIDFDPAKNEVYLLGDISALQKHRYAWRYVRDYLHPAVEADHITIPIGEKEPFDVMSDVSAMLSKYGFTEDYKIFLILNKKYFILFIILNESLLSKIVTAEAAVAAAVKSSYVIA